jgi:hypothetical protein
MSLYTSDRERAATLLGIARRRYQLARSLRRAGRREGLYRDSIGARHCYDQAAGWERSAIEYRNDARRLLGKAPR